MNIETLLFKEISIFPELFFFSSATRALSMSQLEALPDHMDDEYDALCKKRFHLIHTSSADLRFGKSLPTFPSCSNICFHSGLCEMSRASDVDLAANEVSTLVTTAVTISIHLPTLHTAQIKLITNMCASPAF